MARKKVEPEEKQMVAKHEPTPAERELLTAYCTAKEASLPPPKVKVTQNKGSAIEISMDQIGHAIIDNTLATTSGEFSQAMLLDLYRSLNSIERSDPETAINHGLSLVAAIKPRDELETMLAVQMAAIHSATITFSRRLNHVENIPQQDSAERALNKLARTFTTQVEALKRYRTGGEQKVTVHHVTVNEGGQAIVGNVERTKGRGEG